MGQAGLPFEHEDAYLGGLKLGEELQYVFTHDENVAEVQDLINNIGLRDSVKVESIRILEKAGSIENAYVSSTTSPGSSR